MFSWWQLLLAVIAFAREFVKYINNRTNCKKETAKAIREFKEALVIAAKKDGKTNQLEKVLRNLELMGRN